MRSRDQHSIRGLLIMVFVPVVVVLGMLASAVLGTDGVQTGASQSGTGPAPAPAPARAKLPDEPVVAAAPGPVRTTPATPGPPRERRPAPPVASTPEPEPAAPASAKRYVPAGTERLDLGRGAREVSIFRRPGSAGTAGPVVIFLHGWVAIDPRRYGPWIGHLVRNGATVIYPAYQTKPAQDTITPLANVLSSVRVALGRVVLAPGRLVVAGHSAGGALAADYAAVAAPNGLPAPAAVFSVYPGRKLRHLAVPLPTFDLGLIAAGTRVLAYAGERDTAVGSGTARRIVTDAVEADAALQVIRGDAVDDHSAPRRYDGAAQRTFWAPLDELVAATAETTSGAPRTSTVHGGTALP